MKQNFAIITVFCALIGLSLSSCRYHQDERQLKDEANAFADHYFNWQFEKAQSHCSPSSQKWMVYAASQVHQEDVDRLRAMDEGPSHQLNGVAYGEGDTTATVLLQVRNFVLMDSIGTVAHVIDKADFKLNMIFVDSHWKVDLKELPRPLKKMDD